MTGQPRDKAWAQRQVRDQGGRPHRMTVFCLLLDMPGDAWRGMSREEQEAKLRPFMLEDERIHWSNDDEAFIVPVSAVREPNPNSSMSLSELQAAQLARSHWANAAQKLERSAYQRGYAEATIDMAPRYVELERLVLDRALDPKATTAERKMAMAAFKDWKDRHMGKPVAPTEDVTAKPSEISDWIASEPPSVLPLSASWTVESVAEDQRRELEAGTLAVEEAG